ncbi:MAG TPA: nucleotide exchange factor GrpE [Candidatus Ozemobacteraceae bacterium]|nr:nucleotide exchange factor GrpE [Candidatus Ozemobacteraceae bacterium]HQG28548.1 nucleotide exchange factor GrpE [Candidatus Ozemobacteraceae bacterium]
MASILPESETIMTAEVNKTQQAPEAAPSPAPEQAASENAAQPAAGTNATQAEAPQGETPQAEAARPEDPLETLKKEVDGIKKELAETKNRYHRALADYDNLKRRTDQKLLEMSEYGSEAFVKKLLPVLDTFESAMRQLTDAKVEAKIMDGFEMLFFQFNDVLEKEGLKPIPAKGQKFDPNLHEAMSKSTDPNQDDEVVLMEYEKGYMFKKRVMRTAKVVINHK